jgi:hypothetical protein
MNNLKRIVVYVAKEEYQLLRSKLILQGITVSAWIRNVIKKFLSGTNENRSDEEEDDC